MGRYYDFGGRRFDAVELGTQMHVELAREVDRRALQPVVGLFTARRRRVPQPDAIVFAQDPDGTWTVFDAGPGLVMFAKYRTGAYARPLFLMNFTDAGWPKSGRPQVVDSNPLPDLGLR